MDDGRWTMATYGSSFVLGPSSLVETGVFRIAWLYPLARLYSLGPWNNGWSFAALLLGGGAALWATTAALSRLATRRELALMSFLGLALAGIGLGTGAGIAAGCYATLAYLVVALQPTTDHRPPTTDDGHAGREGAALQVIGSDNPSSLVLRPSSLRWLLAGALPLTAPFVAVWMLAGASVAGGVALLAGAAWLALLLNSLTSALASEPPAHEDERPLRVAAAASVILGVGAPLVVIALIQPVIEQLQGGLIPYGDVNIWPWVGLATIDSARTPVTTLPSIAVAALMLVLFALVYLAARLRDAWAPPAPPADVPGPGLGALLARLREEVPWLGGPARSADEEQRVDGE